MGRCGGRRCEEGIKKGKGLRAGFDLGRHTLETGENKNGGGGCFSFEGLQPFVWNNGQHIRLSLVRIYSNYKKALFVYMD